MLDCRAVLVRLARLACVAALILGLAGAFPDSVRAAASLSISPVTWNVIGLDSNDVTTGPNHFPVGVRVCDTGDTAATNVTAAFVWDSSDPYVSLRPGTLTAFTGADAVPSLAVGACADLYFEVEVARDAAAYDHARAYHVAAAADGVAAVSTPTPRELYVEHLVSQSRNHIDDVKLDGVSVPAGGTMTLVVGQTYSIELDGSTATNGYEQVESFINFPNVVFQVLSVDTTYSADTSASVANPSDKLYGDACVWENDPNSPNYRACNDVGKVGGTVAVIYQIKILQVPGAPLLNPVPLNTLIYDFSGSSFHYNSDFSTAARIAAIVDPTTLDIAKSFAPDPTNAGGVSTLTFTLSNPNPAAISGLSFSDTFPTSPGAMVVASPTGATTNGCGSATFAPVAGAGSIGFSDGTVAASGTCTVQVSVTVPATGTYTNTTSNLLVDGQDTGRSATDTLDVNDAPAPPTPVCGLPLAQWIFPTGFTVTSPAPYGPNTTVTASASPGAGLAPIESPRDHTGTPAGTDSWGSNGDFDSTGALDTSGNDYFELAVDTTGLTEVDLSFWVRRPNGNAPTQVLVYYGTSPTPPGTLHATLGSPPGTLFPAASNTWESSGNIAFTSGLNASGLTYFRIYGAYAKNSTPGSDLYLDDVTFTGCGSPQPPTLSKSFSPAAVAAGADSTLTFTLTNPNATLALSGVAFDDTLPSGVTVGSGLSAQCGGTLTMTAPSTLSFSGGSLAAGASCMVTTTVTVTTAGPHDNVSGFVSAAETGANTGASGIATGAVTGVLPPGISKQFAPDPILAGTVSTLTFTLDNVNQDVALSGVAFTDTLPTSPGAMVVAATPAAGTSGCGSPTFVPGPGDGVLSFSGGTVAAGGQCVIQVDVTAPVSGSYANTSGPVSFVIDGVPVDGNSASDTLAASAPAPAIALLKQVGPSAAGPWGNFLAVADGADAYYRFTVENVGNVPLNGVTVDDPLVDTTGCPWPDPLPVASPTDDPTATCVVGPVTAVDGSHPNTATGSGSYGATDVSDDSTATYATTALSIVKSVTESQFTMAGDVLHYSYLVTNTGSAPLAGPVTVSDDKSGAASCPAVSTVGDFDDFLDPGESLVCTATYMTTAGDVTAGFVTNQATATAGGVTSNTDTATVTTPGFTAPPSLTKAFAPSTIAVGGVSTLTLTVENPNAGASLSNVAFTDPLPAGTQVASPPGAVTSGCGTPIFAPTAGQTSLSFSGGSLVAGGTCTVSVAVTATTSGSKVNITGNVTSDAGSGNSASATLTVTPAPPQIGATKASTFNVAVDDLDGSGTLTPGDTLEYTVVITNSGTGDAQNVVFNDTPDANTLLVSGSVTTTQGTVTLGNGGGDTAVSVAVGTLAGGGGEVTVVFNVQIVDPLPQGVTTVHNQGIASGDNFPDVPTDDPSTPAAGDPTADTVSRGGVVAIPALSPWGSLLLALLLAAAGFAAWRRV